jgi:hypothetical protein
MPATPPAVLLGTNKVSSLLGLASSLARYARAAAVPWGFIAPALIIGFVASCAGALTVRALPSQTLRPLIPVLLAGVLANTLWHRRLGDRHAPRNLDRRGRRIGALIIVLLGFYDGFLGPGAGAMMVFALVRVYGFDFLRASASAKMLNFATNAGAFVTFASMHEVIWPLGAALAVASIAGAQIGARMAIARGSGFVRAAFIVVSAALIAKTGWDALRA